MQAFKLNKLFIATALALAFGPGVRVVEAASLCYLPGASQMGMGCGGNTGTADSTLVPNVGAYVPSNNCQPPTWGGDTLAQAFIAAQQGLLPNYVGYNGYNIPAGYYLLTQIQVPPTVPYSLMALTCSTTAYIISNGSSYATASSSSTVGCGGG